MTLLTTSLEDRVQALEDRFIKLEQFQSNQLTEMYNDFIERKHGKFGDGIASGGLVFTDTGTQTATLGFKPRFVLVFAAYDWDTNWVGTQAGVFSQGISDVNGNHNCVYQHVKGGDTVVDTSTSYSFYLEKDNIPATGFVGTVTIDGRTLTFNITENGTSDAGHLLYIAIG